MTPQTPDGDKQRDMKHRWWHKLFGTSTKIEVVSEHTENVIEYCNKCKETVSSYGVTHWKF